MARGEDELTHQRTNGSGQGKEHTRSENHPTAGAIGVPLAVNDGHRARGDQQHGVGVAGEDGERAGNGDGESSTHRARPASHRRVVGGEKL